MNAGDDQHTKLTRRARYQLARCEDALDIATAAIKRVRDLSTLDATTIEEVRSDIDLLRGKLMTLQRLLV
jgi:hypothetical protein